MKASNNKWVDLVTIFETFPKGYRNRSPTKDQVKIKGPSYGLDEFTKEFCVSKKCCNIHPINSDQESNKISTNWSNHF